jgi:S-DNA-T family DNA segregation ATPase FtsK/SpoIIIE
MLGVSLLTGLTWFSVVDKTGFWAIQAACWVQNQWPKALFKSIAPRAEKRPQQPVSAAVRQEPVLSVQELPAFDVLAQEEPVMSMLDQVAISPAEDAAVSSSESTATVAKKPLAISTAQEQASGLSKDLPQTTLLDDAPVEKAPYSREELAFLSNEVESQLAHFGIEAKVVSVLLGPVITRFEMQPAAGIKASKITALSKDLARAIRVKSVRVV